jgi:hypothetical protein
MKIIKQFSIKRQWTNSRGETKLNSNGDLVYFYDHYALGDDGKLYHQATYQQPRQLDGWDADKEPQLVPDSKSNIDKWFEMDLSIYDLKFILNNFEPLLPFI